MPLLRAARVPASPHVKVNANANANTNTNANANARSRWLIDVFHALHALGANVAQIYFIPSASIGWLLLAVLALADWPAALTGLAASAGASCLATALRLPRESRHDGRLGYNAALTGIAFGALWRPDAVFVAWLAVCVGLTVITTVALARYRYRALTLPFVGAMSLTWAMQPWLRLLPRAPGALACDTATPGFVFCSVGQVVFIAPLVLGLLTWYVLALWNARATLWALAAVILVWTSLAATTALWPAMAGQAGGIGINAFLAAFGLGMFERSAAQRFAGAALASLLCIVLGAMLGPRGWPYFTLPFNLAVWIMLRLPADRRQPRLLRPWPKRQAS